MADIEAKLPSGATLVVTTAAFKDAKAFERAVLSALGGGLKGDAELASVLMPVASSPEVETAFFKCAERALYKPDGTDASMVKVTPALFDDGVLRDQVRDDYYAIFVKVAEANIKPFILALFSTLGALAPAVPVTSAFPKSPLP